MKFNKSKMKVDGPKIKRSYYLLGLIISILIIYPLSFFLISQFKGSFSDVFVLWAVITPYVLFLFNHYYQKEKERKILELIIEEIRELFLTINFNLQKPNKEKIKNQIVLLKNQFKDELRKIYCFIDENTITIYTKKGKYVANHSNIIKKSPEETQSLLNVQDTLKFINKIISEIKKSI